MFKNRNGYWMSPKWFALFAPDGGDGNGGTSSGTGAGADSGAAGNDGNGAGGDGGNSGDGNGEDGNGDEVDDKSAAEIARLNAEIAKLKAAKDKATKEAGDANKALKARMTQEEIAAKEKEEADSKAAQELEELRKEVAKAKIVKSVMGKLGMDEEASGSLADHLYGATDIENALLEIQKAWVAKEKELKIQFGKIPPPGAGGANAEDAEEKKAIEFAKAMGQQRAESQKSVQEQLGRLVR